jgi:hypothetical protein
VRAQHCCGPSPQVLSHEHHAQSIVESATIENKA